MYVLYTISKITKCTIKFLGTGNHFIFRLFQCMETLIIGDTIGHSFRGYGFQKKR